MSKRQAYIYVCERGFVLVGRPRPYSDDALFVILDDVAVIRRWGTQRGLGQLAREGPTAQAIFDPEPDGTEIALTYLHRRLPCNQEAWAKWTSQPGG